MTINSQLSLTRSNVYEILNTNSTFLALGEVTVFTPDLHSGHLQRQFERLCAAYVAAYKFGMVRSVRRALIALTSTAGWSIASNNVKGEQSSIRALIYATWNEYMKASRAHRPCVMKCRMAIEIFKFHQQRMTNPT